MDLPNFLSSRLMINSFHLSNACSLLPTCLFIYSPSINSSTAHPKIRASFPNVSMVHSR